VYAVPPVGQGYLSLMAGWPSPLMCFNSTAAPGQLRQVARAGVCRNFRARREPAVWTEPPEPPNDAIRYIPLTRGHYAIVDAADFDWLSRRKWYVTSRGSKAYAIRVERGKTILMHREIMKPPKGAVVDHINSNGLDNRRKNMRNCTQRQNSHNRRPQRNSTSQFAGVYQRRTQGDKWYACVGSGRDKTCFGPFDSEVEAARARDVKARERYGEFAYLNFPAECDLEPATIHR
jgi:hypothetical protein